MWVDTRKERFKYKLNQYKKRLFSHSLNFKRKVNSLLQKRSISKIDIQWGQIFTQSTFWIIEAGVEGLIANISTHYLFGVRFNIMMVFAHGFMIKQGLSIIRRIREGRDDQKIKVELKEE